MFVKNVTVDVQLSAIGFVPSRSGYVYFYMCIDMKSYDPNWDCSMVKWEQWRVSLSSKYFEFYIFIL